MSSSPTLGDVIRAFGPALRERGLTPAQHAVLATLARCHTAALGGHLYRCDACGAEKTAFNGCGNRHCPSCLAHKSAHWLVAREQELLPVPYFHVVFTVPESVAALALGNKQVLYSILFRAAAETLLTVAADPKHLGARIGFLAILHTWTQTLLHHPHLHCVVPAGGLSPDGDRWLACRRDFFLPVRVLSRLFRGKFTAFLLEARRKGALQFAGSTARLANPRAFVAWLRELRRKEWVVYAKPPFGSPSLVLKYLARYTHRVAISNARILRVDDRTVRFQYRDRVHGDRRRTMTLDGVEFLRRFLLHVLPGGFVRIRYFGFLAPRCRAQGLSTCRARLAQSKPDPPPQPDEPSGEAELPSAARARHEDTCPVCHAGLLRPVARVPPAVPGTPIWLKDSS